MKPQPISGWEIFSAISTGVAAIFTAAGVLIALLFSMRQYRESQRQKAAAAAAAERGQADQVAAWLMSASIDPSEAPAVAGLRNASTAPVYGVVVAIIGIQGAVPDGALRTAYLASLPPGEFWTALYGRELDGSMNKRYGVEIAFTDQAGQAWRRSAMGQLAKLNRSPADEYELGMPHGYSKLWGRYPIIEDPNLPDEGL